MRRNLTLKASVIAATILVCLFGIIGFPKFMGGVGIPLSAAQLSSNMQQNIHLGLDLKGGIHLVMRVHVEDAIGSTSDRDVQRLQSGARAETKWVLRVPPKQLLLRRRRQVRKNSVVWVQRFALQTPIESSVIIPSAAAADECEFFSV